MKASVTMLVTYALICVAVLIGWVWNIVEPIGEIGGPVTTKVVMQIVGIFVAPLGGVLGWIW